MNNTMRDYAGKIYLEAQHRDTPAAWLVYLACCVIFTCMVLL